MAGAWIEERARQTAAATRRKLNAGAVRKLWEGRWWRKAAIREGSSCAVRNPGPSSAASSNGPTTAGVLAVDNNLVSICIACWFNFDCLLHIRLRGSYGEKYHRTWLPSNKGKKVKICILKTSVFDFPLSSTTVSSFGNLDVIWWSPCFKIESGVEINTCDVWQFSNIGSPQTLVGFQTTH